MEGGSLIFDFLASIRDWMWLLMSLLGLSIVWFIFIALIVNEVREFIKVFKGENVEEKSYDDEEEEFWE